MSIKRQLSADRAKWTQSRGGFNTQENMPREEEDSACSSQAEQCMGHHSGLRVRNKSCANPVEGTTHWEWWGYCSSESSLSRRATLTETNWALSNKQAPWGVFQPRGARIWIFNRLACLWERETVKTVWKNLSCLTILTHLGRAASVLNCWAISAVLFSFSWKETVRNSLFLLIPH